MKYKILKYVEDQMCFVLFDKNGKTHRVDLFVDASYRGFGPLKQLTAANWFKKMHSFKGRFVEIKELSPYQEIAHGVSLLKQKNEK